MTLVYFLGKACIRVTCRPPVQICLNCPSTDILAQFMTKLVRFMMYGQSALEEVMDENTAPSPTAALSKKRTLTANNSPRAKKTHHRRTFLHHICM